MRLVLADEDGLNAVACDRLLARLAGDRARAAAQITVDLRQAAYVDPYGAACLVLIARQVAERQQPMVCVLPSERRPRQAVVEMGLVQALQPVVELRNVTQVRAGQREGVLPVSVIRSRADARAVLAYLVDQARSRLDFDTGDVLDATKVVSELCHNVVDHSQAEGLVVARITSDRQGRRFVALAVADAGIGIRASLAGQHPEAAGWQHGEATQRALAGLSSRQQGGGAGLRSVHAVVRRYGGRLTIRTCDDRLYIAAERQPRVLAGARFPGTQVGISFSQRDKR